MSISSYIPLCDAITLLMNPLVEVVIHNLKSDTIHYINGNLSQRKVGDPSLLQTQEFEAAIDKVVYPKINFDGRLIKSISIPIENKWLICINCDISIFSQLKDISALFLAHRDTEKPSSLFKNDWQERLHVTIHHFLKQNGWVFEELNHYQKKQLVRYLFDCAAFNEKNAANYVAHTLKLGRATIFKYLKEWRI